MTARAWIAAAVLAGSLTCAASAEAGLPPDSLVTAQPAATIDLNFPLYSTLDPVSEDHVYAIQDIPTHQVLIYHLDDAGSPTPEGAIDLPTGVTPSVLWWDHDGLLHIESRELRSFTYNPDTNGLIEAPRRSPEMMFIAGAAAGFKTDLLTDYGDMTSGSVWYGPNLDQQLVIPGLHPEAVDFSAYGKVTKTDSFSGGLYVVPSAGSSVLQLSDEEPPTVVDTYDGPTGATQLASVAVSPINLDPSFGGAANRPVFASVPSAGGINTGNVYVTNWVTLESGGGWRPFSTTSLGSPTGLDATCKWLLVNDYANDRIDIYGLNAPAAADCDEAVDLLVKTAPKRQLTLAEAIKAYIDAGGHASALFHVRSPKRGPSTVRATAKVKLTAGRVSHVNLKFSKAATNAVNAALEDANRLKGMTTVKATDAGGHKVKLRQALTLKLAHKQAPQQRRGSATASQGKLVAKAG